MLTLKPIPAFSDNYVWLVTAPGSQRAVVVDPGEAKPVLQHLESHGLALEAVLVTHHHGDHVAGIQELVARHPAPVYGSKHEQVAGLTNPIGEGDRVSLPGAGVELTVLETPGHTAGHVCYLGHGLVFTGDTLFTGGCGRVFEDTPQQMYQSLTRLAELPDSTQVYCAHEYTLSNFRFACAVEPDSQTMLARQAEAEDLRSRNQPTVPSVIELEKQTNPFLRCEVPEVRAAAEKHAGRSLPTPVDVFATVRSWKDSF